MPLASVLRRKMVWPGTMPLMLPAAACTSGSEPVGGVKAPVYTATPAEMRTFAM